jgi:hypothetical protein
MAGIRDVAEEEYNRLISLVEFYKNEIGNLPKGSILKKEIKGKEYLYLAYRAGKKIKHDYVGVKDSKKDKEVSLLVEKRKEYEKLLKKTRINLKEVERILITEEALIGH